MTTEKKELQVAALRNGTVIDHIPSHALFKVAKILGIETLDTAVTIGNNLHSGKLGKKGIIKVADVEYPTETINRIALIAPGAKVNVIRDFEVVEKYRVSLPDTIVGIVACNNPKCITNNEPMLTRFAVIERDPAVIRCHYCNREITASKLQII